MLDAWLRHEQWQPIELIRLLVGDDLPAVGSAEEPYVWILRGIGTGAYRADRKARMAARMGEFIEQQPEVELPGPRPEQMFYNLLQLCAGMTRKTSALLKVPGNGAGAPLLTPTWRIQIRTLTI